MEATDFREQLNNCVNGVITKFCEHPTSNGLSYRSHLAQSMYFAMCSMVCAVIFFVHAVIPFLFENTGTKIIAHLNDYYHHTCNDKQHNESDITVPPPPPLPQSQSPKTPPNKKQENESLQSSTDTEETFE